MRHDVGDCTGKGGGGKEINVRSEIKGINKIQIRHRQNKTGEK